MGEQDQYGLTLSTDSAEAADAWRLAIERMCALQEPMSALNAAHDADPGFALAAAYIANFRRFEGDMAGAIAALDGVDMARATPRERATVEVMQKLNAGDGRGACDVMVQTLGLWPTDAPLMSLLHRMLVNSYPSRDRREVHQRIVEEIAPGYPSDDWYILSERAYAAEEVGDLTTAANLAQQALDRNGNSGEAAHALAHVAYERADRSGRGWLEAWLARWEHPSPFINHLTWHVALAALAEGDIDAALRITIEAAPAATMPTMRLANWASVLWRLQLDGATNLPWSTLADTTSPPFMSFAVAHEAMVLAAVGDHDALDRLVETQQGLADSLPGARVAAAVAGACGAIVDDRAADAVVLLEDVRADMVILGGSRAQQDVFEDTIIAAYIGAGRYDDALSMLESRVDRRPFPRDAAWLAHCRAVAHA